MGWKNIKEHYKIRHIVSVEKELIHIGSPYIYNIASIVIKTGELVGRTDFIKETYPELYTALFEKTLSLINTPDNFEQSLPVFTYEGGEIIEKQCEHYNEDVDGYGNVTHDGERMYNNTFFKDKSEAIKAAKENAQAGIMCFERNIVNYQRDLKQQQDYLKEEMDNLAKLEAMV